MAYAALISSVEYVNYALGITFYAFLLYCLLFRTTQNLGKYHYLQIVMVTIDASYTTVQMFIHERIVTSKGLFAMIPTSRYGIGPPLRVRLFAHPAFVALLCSIGLLESLVWFSSIYFLYVPTAEGRRRLFEYTQREFGIDTTNHVMIMGDYYLEDGSVNALPLIGMVILCIVMGICFGFLIYAFFEIVYHLSETKLISKVSIRLQRQLFVTLCLQTIIPLICLYAPCAFCIILPLLRIDSLLVARAIPLLISCFLPLDTLATILSMADYRRELGRILLCYVIPSTTSTPSLTTVHPGPKR